jgi:hypothetical protein
MKLKEAIAEIMCCRITDPARAAALEAQVLRRGANLNVELTDNPELKATRATRGLP